MNSKFLSVVQNLQCQTTNDFLPSDQLQDFLSTFSPAGPIDSFQTPFFDGGVLDADSLGARSPFSDYASEDSFVDVMSPVPCPAPDQEEVRRQRLARKAELARASRKRKQQVNSANNFDEGDSDSSASGSRSPQSDYTDMSMSPGPQPSYWDAGDDEDVRRKRLARKAELARVSRKKKKDRIEELESQLTQMQNELRVARQMSANPESLLCKPEMENNIPIIYPQPSASDRLNQAMSDFANPNYLGAFYTAFIDKIRQDMTQIDQLQASMQSSLCLRFVQWIMNQNDKFYEDSCGLWYSLFSQEVGASPTQLAQLLELRKEFAQKLSMPGPDMVAQAFDALRKAMDDSSRMMGAFAQIFSPAQLVLFFQWVERFGPVCIKINL